MARNQHGDPVADDEKLRILELARTGMARNAIAREVGRSNDVVSRVVREAGLSFDRATTTAAATKARQADNAQRRAELSSRLLDEAAKALDDMHAPYLVHHFGGKDNTYRAETLERPPSASRRDLMVVTGIALQRHADLEHIDGDGGIDEARSLLGSLEVGLRAAADALGT